MEKQTTPEAPKDGFFGLNRLVRREGGEGQLPTLDAKEVEAAANGGWDALEKFIGMNPDGTARSETEKAQRLRQALKTLQEKFPELYKQKREEILSHSHELLKKSRADTAKELQAAVGDKQKELQKTIEEVADSHRDVLARQREAAEGIGKVTVEFRQAYDRVLSADKNEAWKIGAAAIGGAVIASAVWNYLRESWTGEKLTLWQKIKKSFGAIAFGAAAGVVGYNMASRIAPKGVRGLFDGAVDKFMADHPTLRDSIKAAEQVPEGMTTGALKFVGDVANIPAQLMNGGLVSVDMDKNPLLTIPGETMTLPWDALLKFLKLKEVQKGESVLTVWFGAGMYAVMSRATYQLIRHMNPSALAEFLSVRGIVMNAARAGLAPVVVPVEHMYKAVKIANTLRMNNPLEIMRAESTTWGPSIMRDRQLRWIKKGTAGKLEGAFARFAEIDQSTALMRGNRSDTLTYGYTQEEITAREALSDTYKDRFVERLKRMNPGELQDAPEWLEELHKDVLNNPDAEVKRIRDRYFNKARDRFQALQEAKTELQPGKVRRAAEWGKRSIGLGERESVKLSRASETLRRADVSANDIRRTLGDAQADRVAALRNAEPLTQEIADKQAAILGKKMQIDLKQTRLAATTDPAVKMALQDEIVKLRKYLATLNAQRTAAGEKLVKHLATQDEAVRGAVARRMTSQALENPVIEASVRAELIDEHARRFAPTTKGRAAAALEAEQELQALKKGGIPAKWETAWKNAHNSTPHKGSGTLTLNEIHAKDVILQDAKIPKALRDGYLQGICGQEGASRTPENLAAAERGRAPAPAEEAKGPRQTETTKTKPSEPAARNTEIETKKPGSTVPERTKPPVLSEGKTTKSQAPMEGTSGTTEAKLGTGSKAGHEIGVLGKTMIYGGTLAAGLNLKHELLSTADEMLRVEKVRQDMERQVKAAGFVEEPRGSGRFKHPLGPEFSMTLMNPIEEQKATQYIKTGVAVAEVGVGLSAIVMPSLALGPAGWAVAGVAVSIHTALESLKNKDAREFVAKCPPWLLVAMGGSAGTVGRSEYEMLSNASSWNFVESSPEVNQETRSKMLFTIFTHEVGGASPAMLREMTDDHRSFQAMDNLYTNDFRNIVQKYMAVRFYQRNRDAGNRRASWSQVKEGRVDSGDIIHSSYLSYLDVRTTMREGAAMEQAHVRERRYMELLKSERHLMQTKEGLEKGQQTERAKKDLADTGTALEQVKAELTRQGAILVYGQPLQSLTTAMTEKNGWKTRTELLISRIHDQIERSPDKPDFRVDTKGIEGLPPSIDLSNGTAVYDIVSTDAVSAHNLRHVAPLTTDEDEATISSQKMLTRESVFHRPITGLDENFALNGMRERARDVAMVSGGQINGNESWEASQDIITNGITSLIAKDRETAGKLERNDPLAASLYGKDTDILVFQDLRSPPQGGSDSFFAQREMIKRIAQPPNQGNFARKNVVAVCFEGRSTPRGDVMLATFVYGDGGSKVNGSQNLHVLQQAAIGRTQYRKGEPYVNHWSGSQRAAPEKEFFQQQGAEKMLASTAPEIAQALEQRALKAEQKKIEESRRVVQADNQKERARAAFQPRIDRAEKSQDAFVETTDPTQPYDRHVREYRRRYGDAVIINEYKPHVDGRTPDQPTVSNALSLDRRASGLRNGTYMREPTKVDIQTADLDDESIAFRIMKDGQERTLSVTSWQDVQRLPDDDRRIFMDLITTPIEDRGTALYRMIGLFPRMISVDRGYLRGSEKFDLFNRLGPLYEAAADKKTFLVNLWPQLVSATQKDGGLMKDNVIAIAGWYDGHRNYFRSLPEDVAGRLREQSRRLGEETLKASGATLLSEGEGTYQLASGYKEKDSKAEHLLIRFTDKWECKADWEKNWAPAGVRGFNTQKIEEGLGGGSLTAEMRAKRNEWNILLGSLRKADAGNAADLDKILIATRKPNPKKPA
ncbi:MAG: hypothetical protein Greene041619_657 [Candidatus Peregrinibacteria bacterium Greene0416_19]|nr:MAG: hypothetical protein Greene041619_657 [Candidatus Peregrinibacteria bacterium Greene0416_19]